MITQSSELYNMTESCTQCDFEEPPSDDDLQILESSLQDYQSLLEDHRKIVQEQPKDSKYFSCQIGVRSYMKIQDHSEFKNRLRNPRTRTRLHKITKPLIRPQIYQNLIPIDAEESSPEKARQYFNSSKQVGLDVSVEGIQSVPISPKVKVLSPLSTSRQYGTPINKAPNAININDIELDDTFKRMALSPVPQSQQPFVLKLSNNRCNYVNQQQHRIKQNKSRNKPPLSKNFFNKNQVGKTLGDCLEFGGGVLKLPNPKLTLPQLNLEVNRSIQLHQQQQQYYQKLRTLENKFNFQKVECLSASIENNKSNLSNKKLQNNFYRDFYTGNHQSDNVSALKTQRASKQYGSTRSDSIGTAPQSFKSLTDTQNSSNNIHIF